MADNKMVNAYDQNQASANLTDSATGTTASPAANTLTTNAQATSATASSTQSPTKTSMQSTTMPVSNTQGESSPPNHSGSTSSNAAGAALAAAANNSSRMMGFEDGLDYTVNESTDSSLKPGDKRTVNYLVHRMIWDQQEKLDVDDRAISKDGTMEVQDHFDIEQSGLK